MGLENMTILPFSTEYTEQVATMILEIQQNEFNLPITAKEQPDLFDIPNFYQSKKGNFWIALLDGKVIGSIAIIDIGNSQVAMRKMFVHRDYRGRKIGTAHKLLSTLQAWAQEKEIDEILLGTTAKMHAAQKFYINNGFREIPKNELPETFPIMEVDSKFYFYRRN